MAMGVLSLVGVQMVVLMGMHMVMGVSVGVSMGMGYTIMGMLVGMLVGVFMDMFVGMDSLMIVILMHSCSLLMVICGWQPHFCTYIISAERIYVK